MKEKLEFIFNKLTEIEFQLVFNKVQKHPFKEKNPSLINEMLHVFNESNVAFQAHKIVVNNLTRVYIEKTAGGTKQSALSLFPLIEELDLSDDTDGFIDDIPQLCEQLHISFLNSKYCFKDGGLKKEASKHYLRDSGSVYTPEKVASHIVTKCLKNIENKKDNIENTICLDFASGTGSFYFEAVKVLNEKYKIPLDKCIQNLYAVDLDEVAISILKLKAVSILDEVKDETLQAINSNIVCKNILYSNGFFESQELDICDSNNNSIEFDVVFSNPPYLVLKVNVKRNKPELASYYEELKKKINLEIDFFRKSGYYRYSIQGMLNYYQLSIERILSLTKPGGQVGIICPSSLFGDASVTKLRRHILEDNNLLSVEFFGEKERIFDGITQATSIFFLEKDTTTKTISVELSGRKFDVDFDLIRSAFSERLEVPPIDQVSWSILSKFSMHRKIKDMDSIRNRRGEFDLSLFKEFISQEKTRHALVRGNMLEKATINYDKCQEFVDIDEFLSRKSKDYLEKDFGKARLVCQQISNESQSDRVNFVWCRESDIVANSCNYISGPKDLLSKLQFVLNSSLLDWRFQITSTNNHVNNYELDDLPVFDLEGISESVFSDNDKQNDLLVCKMFGLTDAESTYIVQDQYSHAQ